MFNDIAAIVPQIIINTVIIIILLTFHEYGHARIANLFGDRTAEYAGRMTLNPAAHIDPIGTLILPLFLSLMSGGRASFGWARPVPVDPRMLKNPKKDMMFIAGAGPFMNFSVAFLILAIQRTLDMKTAIPAEILFIVQRAALISIFLAVFNLIPLYPLDGYSVVYGLLPNHLAREFAKTEKYGFIILIAVIFLLPWILPINPVMSILGMLAVKTFNFMDSIISFFLLRIG
ncbi:site-2 protease family protein [Candidatus Poribacteria bacterium]|nr:site-2 protease family protein [Candidatus Poribacteria bacterium]